MFFLTLLECDNNLGVSTLIQSQHDIQFPKSSQSQQIKEDSYTDKLTVVGPLAVVCGYIPDYTPLHLEL